MAFDAIYDSMFLTRAALNLKGIYVNEKAKGVRDFMDTFTDIKDVGVVRELWQRWLHWYQTPVSYYKACEYASRVGELALRLDAR